MHRLIDQYNILCTWCRQIAEKMKRGEPTTPAEVYHIQTDLPALVRLRQKASKNVDTIGFPAADASPGNERPARPSGKRPKKKKEGELFE